MTKINFKNNKTKTSTIVAIVSIIVLFGSMNTNVLAMQEKISNPSQQWTKENAATWQSYKASIQPLTTISTGASCTHSATWLNPCYGWNPAPFASDFYYETPYMVAPYHHSCGTYDCVDTDIQLENVTPISYGGHSYDFVSANSVSCTADHSLCSNPVYWQAPYNDVSYNVDNVPSNVAIQHETDYLYRASGQPDLHILVTDYLQYGYN